MRCHLCIPGNNLPCCALWHLRYIYYPDLYLLWRRQVAAYTAFKAQVKFRQFLKQISYIYIFENQVILEGFKFQLPEVRKKRVLKLLGFQCVAMKLKGCLNICILYLVYSQI